MKGQIIKTFCICTGILFLLFTGYTFLLENGIGKEDTENLNVLLNEIVQLTAREDGSNPAKAQFEKLQEEVKRVSTKEQTKEINMIQEIFDERYYVADEAIYDAFFLLLSIGSCSSGRSMC